MKKVLAFFLIIGLIHTMPFWATDEAFAFQGQGCGQECSTCHTLSKDEAKKLIKADAFKADVSDIKMSPVKGLWEVEVTREGKKIAIYIDFAKKYLVEGKFTLLAQLGKPPELKKVNFSQIPLADAVIMGDPKAKTKVIVFDDPDCPYCKKLHEEIKKILETRKDIAFYIKLFPLDIHPEAYEKSKSIICNKKSVKLLDDAFAGKKLPQSDCETKEVDENIKLGKSLGITGTPTIIFPDGRLLPGYVEAQTLLRLLETP
jgi:thiol:disulfide interchange protein DsbC